MPENVGGEAFLRSDVMEVAYIEEGFFAVDNSLTDGVIANALAR